MNPGFQIPNYVLEGDQPLGVGAMAEVWLASHRLTGRKAAIKVLKPSAMTDEEHEKLFVREGQVLAGFDHRNIVRIYDIAKTEQIAYLVMECLTGGTLLQRMQQRSVTVGEALGLVVQIADALGVAHQQQVIHRDLKPANIMLRDETTPVLTDFGAARVLDRSTIYGRDGGIIGTPLYMSPEQITGQPLGGNSDLYALGVIFHELLTGRLPYPGGSLQEIASQHLFAPLPALPEALHMLQPVLDKLLAKKPAERFANAQELIDALRRVFIDDEALRRQVGFSGTSMAWSSQLRALGFVLDPQQKDEARIAQGEYLQRTLAQDQPVAAARSAATRVARMPPVAWLAAAVVLLLLGWALLQDPETALEKPGDSGSVQAERPPEATAQEQPSVISSEPVAAAPIPDSPRYSGFEMPSSAAGFQFIDEQRAWAAGGDPENGQVFHSADGGQTWTSQLDKQVPLFDVFFLDADHGWVVGGALGGIGTVLHTTDGGKTWTKQREDREVWTYFSVFFIDRNIGWIGGSDSNILHTRDGGKTWLKQETHLPYPKSINPIDEIQFVDAKRGWAMNGNGVLATADAGNTWHSIYELPHNVTDLNSIDLIDADNGWIVGRNGLALRTVNAGKNWKKFKLPGSPELLVDVQFLDSNRGWLLADNQVFSTLDRGETWLASSLPDEYGPRRLQAGPQKLWISSMKFVASSSSFSKRMFQLDLH